MPVPVPRIISTVFLLCLFGAFPYVSYAQTNAPAASAAAAPAVNERGYSLDYKDGLLSVREEGGKYLFAQAATTPVIQVRVEAARGRGIKMTLQDEKGKSLWSSPLAVPEAPEKGRSRFAFKSSQKGGIQFTLGRADAPAKPTEEKSLGKLSLVATLRSDNAFLVGDVDAGEDTMHFQRLDDGTGMTFTTYKNGKQDYTSTIHFDDANKQVTATVNGQEVASGKLDANAPDQPITLMDTKGMVALRTIKQDGKEYVEVLLGDRRFLIEGTSFSAQLKDSVIILSITPAVPAAGKP